MNHLLLQSPLTSSSSRGIPLLKRHQGRFFYRVAGEFSRHIFNILKKKRGEYLKVGLLGHGTLNARLEESTPSDTLVSIPESFESELKVQAPALNHLILALPRPKALLRIIENAVSVGVTRIDLIESWKVEKSYFSSSKLNNDSLDRAVIHGLQQARKVHWPHIVVSRGFRRYVEDIYPTVSEKLHISNETRFLMHQDGLEILQRRAFNSMTPISIAIGPEGGFIESECLSFLKIGFQKVRLFDSIVKTEVAVTAALAQTELLRQYR